MIPIGNLRELFNSSFPRCVMWSVILLGNVFFVAKAIDLDPSRFSDVLKEVQKNILGVKKMQDYFDRLQFAHEPVDGNRIADKLTERLKQRFNEKIEIANEIRDAVEDAFRQNSVSLESQFPECCNINPTKVDYRFQSEILADEACYSRANNLHSNAKHLPKSILETMKRILKEKPNTKWQYFGSQDGLYFNFPAVKFSSCFFDHRVRPWYVQGIAPEGKDVVIILDKSGSMVAKHGGKTLMDIAVDAASTVLDSLNSKDRIGIVAFSSEAETPGKLEISECYDTELAQAVPVNIKYLKKYLKDIRPRGLTYYSRALRKGFELLKSSEVGARNETLQQRRKVILFLTDGLPTEPTSEEILDVFNEEKESLKKATSKDAVIFAYGIGDSDFSLLKRIAGDTEAEGTKGTFTAIKAKDVGELRGVLSSFYDQFARTGRSSFSLSVPFYDLLGLGVLVSVVVPVWSRGKVIGVAGTDVAFSDLISDVLYFSEGDYSYAFLIDRETGNTIIHPQMPTLQAGTDDPVILHITALEQAQEFQTVLASMLRGEEGTSSFTSKRFLPVGSGIDAGVRELEINSSYYWRAVEGTNLAVCVVLGGSGSETVLKINDYGRKSMVYHREIDLVKDKVGFTECSHYGKHGTNDRAVVKFAPQSFEKPFEYLSMTETKQTVKAFKDYIRNGVNNPKPIFKHGIREMVVPGFKAEEIWDGENSLAKDYVTYFTYATPNGIIFVKPGVVIDKTYDPSKRSWFQNAVNNKGNLSLSTPYLDALGSGFLVDVVHTLQEKSHDGERTEHNDAIAVLDAAFGMFQFYRLFTVSYPECLRTNVRCFIMDKNGFLIVHKHFVEAKTQNNLKELAKRISSVHITVQEKGIAEDLIDRNILRRKQCKKYKEIAVENFYEVDLAGTVKSSFCPNYQISYLEGTNAYLGIVDDSGCSSRSVCACPSSIYNARDKECVCPFLSKIDYHYCKNEFVENGLPLCPVPQPLLTSFEAPVESKSDLVDCNEGNCKQSNVESCYREKTCSWCKYDKNTLTLNAPYCASKETCYGGVKGNRLSSLYPDGDKNTESSDPADDGDGSSSNVAAIVGGVIAGLVLLTVVGIIVRQKILKKKKKREMSADNRHSGSQNVPAQSSTAVPGEPVQFTHAAVLPQMQQNYDANQSGNLHHNLGVSPLPSAPPIDAPPSYAPPSYAPPSYSSLQYSR